MSLTSNIKHNIEFRKVTQLRYGLVQDKGKIKYEKEITDGTGDWQIDGVWANSITHISTGEREFNLTSLPTDFFGTNVDTSIIGSKIVE